MGDSPSTTQKCATEEVAVRKGHDDPVGARNTTSPTGTMYRTRNHDHHGSLESLGGTPVMRNADGSVNVSHSVKYKHTNHHLMPPRSGEHLYKSRSIDELFEKHTTHRRGHNWRRKKSSETNVKSGCKFSSHFQYMVAYTGAKFGATPMLSPTTSTVTIRRERTVSEHSEQSRSQYSNNEFLGEGSNNTLLHVNTRLKSVSAEYLLDSKFDVHETVHVNQRNTDQEQNRPTGGAVSPLRTEVHVTLKPSSHFQQQFESPSHIYSSSQPSSSSLPSSPSINTPKSTANTSPTHSESKDNASGNKNGNRSNVRYLFKASSAGCIRNHCSDDPKSKAFNSLDATTDMYGKSTAEAAVNEPFTEVHYEECRSNPVLCTCDSMSISDSHSITNNWQQDLKNSIDSDGYGAEGDCEGHFLNPHWRASLSRKSSASDSAIGSGDERSASPSDISVIDKTDEHLASFCSGNNSQIVNNSSDCCLDSTTYQSSKTMALRLDRLSSERPRSPKLLLSELQTPSFTKIMHPPSVVISDYSFELSSETQQVPQNRSESSPEQPPSQSSSKDLFVPAVHRLQRKLSDSSVSSERSDFSTKSDSSHDDDESREEGAISSITRSTSRKDAVSISFDYTSQALTLYN